MGEIKLTRGQLEQILINSSSIIEIESLENTNITFNLITNSFLIRFLFILKSFRRA